MQPTIPIFVMIVAIIRGDISSLDKRRIGGLALAAFGAAGGAYAASSNTHGKGINPDERSDGNIPLAFALLIIQALAMALLLTYQAKFLQDFPNAPSLLTTAMLYTCAALVTIPVALLQPAKDFALTGTSTAWLALLYCVVFATAFSYGAIAWVTKRGISPGTVSIFITLEPFITASLSAVFLDLIPADVPLFLVGAVMVAAGVLLTLAQPERREAAGVGFQAMTIGKHRIYVEDPKHTDDEFSL
jgi:drug/metabolite transporter (DMT)-like permease